jgi:hypothetical protein
VTKKFLGVVATVVFSISPCSYAGAIYLCRAYNGGMFWAQAHCTQHNALIERIVNVPDGIPWDQKVAIGEQQLRGAARNVEPAPQVNNSPPSNKATCAALDARVSQLDDMARQPQSAATQDWIRSERKNARDRQFGLHC